MKLKIFFSVSFFIICLFSYGQYKIDSLLTVVKKAKADTNTVNAYSELCKEYGSANYQKAVKSGQQGLQLSLKIQCYSGAVNCLNNIGLVYFSLGNYSKALEYFSKSLKVNQYSGNKSGEAFCYNAIGIINMKLGNYAVSIEYYQKSLKIYEANNDKNGIAKCFNNIGNTYYAQNNYDLALKYLKQSLIIKSDNENKTSRAVSLLNIGNIFYFQKNDTLALKYYLESLSLIKDFNNDTYSGCLSNIGNIYSNQGDYPKAIYYYRKSFNTSVACNDKNGIASTLVDLASLYKKTVIYEKAIEYAIQGINIAKEIKTPENIKNAAGILADCYLQTGNYQKACEYQKLFKETNDSIYNITSAKQIKEIEAKYQSEKKEKEITVLQKEKEIQAAKLSRSRLMQGVYIAGIILVIIFSILVYSRYRLKQKKILADEKLKSKKAQLQAVIDGQEQERQRIARDLHDGIGQTMAGIKINFGNIERLMDTISPENKNLFRNTSSALDTACKEVRDLSHRMMPKALNEAGLAVAVSELLERTFANSNIKFYFSKYSLGEIDKNIEIALYRITQELLNNILKHANAGKIALQLFRAKDEIVLIVEDDGTGIKNKGASVPKGIGLSNIESRVQAMNGIFSIYPGKDSGTVASARVPLRQ